MNPSSDLQGARFRAPFCRAIPRSSPPSYTPYGRPRRNKDSPLELLDDKLLIVLLLLLLLVTLLLLTADVVLLLLVVVVVVLTTAAADEEEVVVVLEALESEMNEMPVADTRLPAPVVVVVAVVVVGAIAEGRSDPMMEMMPAIGAWARIQRACELEK